MGLRASLLRVSARGRMRAAPRAHAAPKPRLRWAVTRMQGREHELRKELAAVERQTAQAPELYSNDPRLAHALVRLGECLQEQSKLAEAELYLRRCVLAAHWCPPCGCMAWRV